jgi:hypothetical protein
MPMVMKWLVGIGEGVRPEFQLFYLRTEGKGGMVEADSKASKGYRSYCSTST